jgi:hypothetical protein
MMTNPIACTPDRELLDALARATGDDRRVTTELLALLGEVDARRLYLGEGCSSLFTYCTEVLRFSEHAAYHRIEVARAARAFPMILDLVAEGGVTLTTVALLRPHLTKENHGWLLEAARHKSKRDVEHQVACLAPRPDVAPMIRRLPSPSPAHGPARIQEESTIASQAPTSTAPPNLVVASVVQPPKPLIAPLASDRFLLRVTLSAEAHAKLRRAQQLMGHSLPEGDPATILEKALSLLVAELERVKIASVKQPSAGTNGRSLSLACSRHIPAAVRRQVWARDDGRCAFVGPRGRCTETSRLEFHHLVPFARGGPTISANLSVRCRAHNGYESELAFGPRSRRSATIPGDQPDVAAPDSHWTCTGRGDGLFRADL